MNFTLIGTESIAQPDGGKLFKQNCASCHQISDIKLVGPGLKDITKKRSEEWLIQFIKDSQKLIKSGDADAIKVFEENNKIVMPPQNLKDDEVKALLSYIDAGGVSAKTEQVGSSSDAIPNTNDNNEGMGVITWILIGVSLLLIAVIYAVYSAKKAIEYSKGISVPSSGYNAISEGVGLWILRNKKIVIIVIFTGLLFGMKKSWDALATIGVSTGYAPEQPINFSHKIHAGDNKISCVYCHSSASKGKTAGIPSANVCMNCHKFIQEGATTGTQEISKIYAALDYDPATQKYGDNPKPIKWVRIHNLPDLAYFNHSQHVVAGKQECQTCHGQVEEMSVVSQHAPLTMGWCVDCHKNTEVSMEGNEYYAKLHEEFKEKYKDQKITVDKIGGFDCAKCHY